MLLFSHKEAKLYIHKSMVAADQLAFGPMSFEVQCRNAETWQQRVNRRGWDLCS